MNLSHDEQRQAHAAVPDGRNNAKHFMAELWDWMKSTLIALIVFLFIHQFVFNLSTVEGHSMEPTLLDGEWLFINKFNYLIDSPERGDIVIFKDQDKQVQDPQYLVKRIVGMPGDKVEIHRSKLYINGEEMQEPYTAVDIEDGEFSPVTVPDGHYFVMGDNRHLGASKDSRKFGTVPGHIIEGKAEFIIWPFSQWSKLN